jgi:hypothetical protein
LGTHTKKEISFTYRVTALTSLLIGGKKAKSGLTDIPVREDRAQIIPPPRAPQSFPVLHFA